MTPHRPRSRSARPADRGKTEKPVSAATPLRYFWVPLAFTLALVIVSTLDRVSANPNLVGSFWVSAGVLLAWQAWLFTGNRAAHSARAFEFVLRPQHYLQACLQGAVFAYWGWYWRPVYDHFWLLVAQLLFAYAFGILLAWSRRRPYALGFGALPIVFSTNLFLWFRDDWFLMQFVLVAVGLLGKEFVTWNRDGRRTHIFNPSAFALGAFAILLLAADATHLTWGQEIASTLSMAPRIYLVLFLVGLVAMYSFSITLISGLASVVLFTWSAGYFTATGVPYFVDSEIPSAVFLGLHLLVTDPSTSPRTPLGKAIFGLLYGTSVVVLFAGLDAIGAPRFYDKLLAVPLLNLGVQRIDAVAHRIQGNAWWSRLRLDWSAQKLNLVHMAIWIAFFGAMAGLGRTDGHHTGDSVPFWMHACDEAKPTACNRLLEIEYGYCADNSGWACNQLGRHLTMGRIAERDDDLGRRYFARACEARFQSGCLNLLGRDDLVDAPPRALDLRLLLREGRATLVEMSESALYARACEHDWEFACELLASPPAE